jgi:hypothetical protein
MTVNQLLDPSLAPLLHPGVQIIRNKQSLYIGFTHRGIEVSCASLHQLSEIATVLGECKGKKALGEILTPARDASAIQALAHQLINEKLLSMVGPTPRSRSENEIIFRARSQPEIDLAYFNPSVDAPIDYSLIQNRSEKSILIFGENRLSHLIQTLLHATGFGPVKIINRESGFAMGTGNRNSFHKDLNIKQEEIIGLAFRAEDVGANRAAILNEIRRSSALSTANTRTALTFPQVPDFIITTQVTHSDYAQRWMSEAIPHLQISGLIENFVEMGPLVVPGHSPCLRCIALAETEANPIYQLIALGGSFEPARELPAAGVAYIAGAAVLEVSNYFQSGKSQLIGAKASFDLLNTSGPVLQYWAPHKRCGCMRVQLAQ